MTSFCCAIKKKKQLTLIHSSCHLLIFLLGGKSTFVNILPQLFDSPWRFDLFLGYWCKSINHRKLLIVLPSGLLVSHLIVFCLIYFSSVPYTARRYLNKNVFCAYMHPFFLSKNISPFPFPNNIVWLRRICVVFFLLIRIYTCLGLFFKILFYFYFRLLFCLFIFF